MQPEPSQRFLPQLLSALERLLEPDKICVPPTTEGGIARPKCSQLRAFIFFLLPYFEQKAAAAAAAAPQSNGGLTERRAMRCVFVALQVFLRLSSTSSASSGIIRSEEECKKRAGFIVLVGMSTLREGWGQAALIQGSRGGLEGISAPAVESSGGR